MTVQAKVIAEEVVVLEVEGLQMVEEVSYLMSLLGT